MLVIAIEGPSACCFLFSWLHFLWCFPLPLGENQHIKTDNRPLVFTKGNSECVIVARVRAEGVFLGGMYLYVSLMCSSSFHIPSHTIIVQSLPIGPSSDDGSVSSSWPDLWSLTLVHVYEILGSHAGWPWLSMYLGTFVCVG